MRWQIFLLFIVLSAPACNMPVETPTIISTIEPDPIKTQTSTPIILPSVTPASIPSPTSTITPFPEPIGCLKPPDDYTRIEVNGQTLNQRTLSMLQHAAELYDGRIDVANLAITQGSYTDAVGLSFGTHGGGGAVDISVVARERFEILWDEIPPLLQALRTAGFAAWLREAGELSPTSAVHIHAIAIGDAEVSEDAEAQLTGEYGYFRGYNGLPPEFGGPALDKYGEPILCNWMRDLGYADLRD